jgi:prephenate dehydrogenase
VSNAASSGSDFGPVLVIGAGLIGGSIGLALRRRGIDVFLEDVNHQSLATAESIGVGTDAKALAQSDAVPTVVVVAVPPSSAGMVLAQATKRFPEATITDVSSVKAPVLDQARLAGADMARVVGGHPMAGRETAGAASSRADLFDDRMWIICAPDDAQSDRVEKVRQLATLCGAIPVEMAAEDHDAAVALISHVPQILSSALAGQLASAPEGHVVLAGQGLRDMTRIAGSDSALWTDILSANSANVQVVLRGLIGTLESLQEDLAEATSAESVRGFLDRGGQGKLRIPGKHGTGNLEFTEVMVMIADEPGELARLFGAVGEVDVNLEDVRIEHVLGKPSGLVGLFVKPSSTSVLIEGLSARGFDVR